MTLETFVVLLCFNPEVNSIKQHFIDENVVVEVISGKPDEKCYYAEVALDGSQFISKLD